MPHLRNLMRQKGQRCSQMDQCREEKKLGRGGHIMNEGSSDGQIARNVSVSVENREAKSVEDRMM